MSKKQRKPIVPVLSGRSPAPTSPAGILQEALSNLRRGNYEAVHEQITHTLKFKLDPAQAATAREILAEAHFRAAMADTALDDRLYHLDAALQQTPTAAKVHFYRGITLWQLGRVAEALSELDATAARQPDRRGLAYLARIGAHRDQPAVGDDRTDPCRRQYLAPGAGAGAAEATRTVADPSGASARQRGRVVAGARRDAGGCSGRARGAV